MYTRKRKLEILLELREMLAIPHTARDIADAQKCSVPTAYKRLRKLGKIVTVKARPCKAVRTGPVAIAYFV